MGLRTGKKEFAMSTYFILSRKVSANDLFGGRLATFGIREHVSSDTSERSRCLTDGRNYLWVNLTEDGFVDSLTRSGANAPGKILAAISEAFETDVFSEYEPQYWGFDTKEEWEAAWKKISDQDRDQFYADVCAYIRGEPNNIKPGTIGEIKAKIAKTLVESQAALLQPENKDRLLAEMDAIYDRDHAVIIALGPEDMALVKMLATHEDDLPQA
jgi:hypothetical protein